MNIKVFQNRKIEKDYFYNEGTQNENKSTVLTFEVPLGYEDFSKRIVFITEDGNFWDYIPENEYEIKNNITKYGAVEAYLWLTKDDQDFRSQNFELNFYDNEHADDLVPTEEEIDGFATIIKILEEKIDEVEALKIDIGDFKKALEDKVDKKEGYGLSQNDFTNELKTTLENLENYDDTEIKESVKNIKNDLTNYYKKSETYSKQEIDNKISKIPKLDIEVVDSLPTENISEEKLYLVKSGAESENLYTEYIYVNGKWEKLGEQKLNISHLATKIELEEVKTELNAEIERLTAENEQQAEQIKDLDNILPRAEAEGEYINVKDSAEYKADLEQFIGNIYQETREGYNLFNNEDILEGHYVGATGEVIASNYSNVSGYIEVKADTTYTLKYDYTTLSNIGDRRVNLYDLDKNLLSSNATGVSTKSKTFTPTEDGYVRFTYDINCFDIMVYEGTDEKDYEDYGAMPSIDYPSEIETTKGKQNIQSVNKNLINFKKWYGNEEELTTSIITIHEITENSITFTSNVDDSYTSTFGINRTDKNSNKLKYEKWSDNAIKENAKYTFSYETDTEKTRFLLCFYDEEFNFLSMIDFIKNGQVITTPEKAKYFTYRVGAISSIGVTTTVKNIQLEEGTVATGYVECKSQKYDLDLPELTDLDYIIKNIKAKGRNVLKLTSDLNWKVANNVMYTEAIQDYKISTGNIVYCNMFRGRNNVNVSSSIGDNECCFYINHTAYRFYCKSSIVDVEEWKTFLDNNDVYIAYELEEAVEEEITDETLIAQLNELEKNLKTYKGTTNIFTISEEGVSPTLKIKYVQDAKISNENLQSQIDKINSAIVALGANV